MTRPLVAFPAALEQEGEHFASGVNAPGEVAGLALSGRHVGITCGEIRVGLLEQLEMFAGASLRLFGWTAKTQRDLLRRK